MSLLKLCVICLILHTATPFSVQHTTTSPVQTTHRNVSSDVTSDTTTSTTIMASSTTTTDTPITSNATTDASATSTTVMSTNPTASTDDFTAIDNNNNDDNNTTLKTTITPNTATDSITAFGRNNIETDSLASTSTSMTATTTLKSAGKISTATTTTTTIAPINTTTTTTTNSHSPRNTTVSQITDSSTTTTTPKPIVNTTTTTNPVSTTAKTIVNSIVTATPTTTVAPKTTPKICKSFLIVATKCFTGNGLDMKQVLKGMLLAGDFQASAYRYQCQHVDQFKRAEACLLNIINRCSKSMAALFPQMNKVNQLLDETCHTNLNFTCFDRVDTEKYYVETCIRRKYNIEAEIAMGVPVKHARCLKNLAQIQCEADVIEPCDYFSAHFLESQFHILYPNGCCEKASNCTVGS